MSLLTALFGGIVLSRATRSLNHYGYHNDMAVLFNKSVEMVSWVLVGFLSGKICEESTPRLASILFFMTVIGSGVLLDGLIYPSQELLNSEAQHQQLNFRTADASECREIIKSGRAPAASKNTLSALEARARPNQRLKLAFGVDSCFTSSDEKSCKTFRTSVEKLLYVDEKEWIEFATTARSTAQEALDVQGDTTSLFGVVQLLTLKTMMRVLWPDRDPKQSTNEQIVTLAHEVNLQWLRSKGHNNSDNPSWLFDKQESLSNAVKAVFPDWDEADSTENPCNLILPGYETMWRVVLRCFVEIKARHHLHAPFWERAMCNFVKKPTKQQLESPGSLYNTGVAAVHVAKETLRLYPPTRRIYREHRSTDDQLANVSADIEAMQRDPVVWQAHPNEFVPERWVGVEEGYDEGFMPFGAKPFNCPAKRWNNVPMPFGLSIIALLVGALIQVTNYDWRVSGSFPNKECPLDTDREAYSTAVLRRSRLFG
ncbi:hypothetical protein E4T49_03965 [Aureobasidium sp. EXF-10728]|nr:hypothetical protein E4T49_03965 [Aureobasidium sp. EXF-10728]